MKLKFLFAFIVLQIVVTAQVPYWQWAHNGINDGTDYAAYIGGDRNGNCYGIGTFLNGQTSSFPVIAFGTHTLVCDPTDYTGAYITKYDSLGHNVWAQNIHGGNIDPYGIKTDSAGNSYVVVNGIFTPTLTAGTVSFSTANESVIILKYNSAGNALWACGAGSCAHAPYSRPALGFDTYGNSYVTGSATPSTTLTFDSLILTKINPSGHKLWKKYVHCNGWYAYSMTTDKRGNSYITGCLKAGYTINFHGASVTNTSTTGTSVFVAKYDSSGTIAWAKDLSASGFLSLNDPHICIDASGNNYITGHFTGGSVSFGGTTFSNYNTTAFSSDDIFLVKLDNQGGFVWAKNAGGGGSDQPTDIASDNEGNIFVTGDFENSATFGNTSVSGVNNSLFVTKYDSNGNAIWAKGSGGSNTTTHASIATGINDHVYISGNFFGKRFVLNYDTLINSDTVNTGSDNYFAMLKSKHPYTGIIQNNKDLVPLSIFPNPLIGETIIHSPEFLSDAGLIIYNAVGQEVKKITAIKGFEYKIERDNLLPGVYFISLADKGKAIRTGKLLVE